MRPRLPASVWVLGFAALLNDAASEMVVPLLPVFLAVNLGGSALALGGIEGAADAVAALLKFVGGRLGDRTGRQKPLVLVGYGISNVVRPLLAFATSATHVLGVRVVDRVGKGLRTSPRDALIAAVTAPGARSTAFSTHRAMDHAGAIVGAGVAWLVLRYGFADLRTLFLSSAIPGIACAAAVIFFVKETPTAPAPPVPVAGGLSPGLRTFLVAAALFGLGRPTDAFLLLRAADVGVPTSDLPLLWMALHLVKSATSLLVGPVADRIGPRAAVTTGWVAYAALLTAFGVARTPHEISLAFAVYGLYHGLSEGAERAMVASLAPPDARGTVFGWYNMVTGVVALPAGLLFGAVWARWGSPAAYAMAAVLALAALVPLRRAPSGA